MSTSESDEQQSPLINILEVLTTYRAAIAINIDVIPDLAGPFSSNTKREQVFCCCCRFLFAVALSAAKVCCNDTADSCRASTASIKEIPIPRGRNECIAI